MTEDTRTMLHTSTVITRETLTKRYPSIGEIVEDAMKLSWEFWHFKECYSTGSPASYVVTFIKETTKP